MPGTRCSVAICKSNAIKAKKEGEKIKFFNFPKNPTICKQWVRNCYRKGKWSTVNKRICSKHFTEDDYEDGLKARLLNKKPEKLKPTAIPSLNVLSHQATLPVSSKRDERNLKREQKQIEEEALATSNLGVPIEETAIQSLPSTSSETQIDVLQREMNALIEENRSLKILLEKRDQQVTLLQQKIKELEDLARTDEADFEKKIKETLSHFLSSNQVDIILKKKQKARWTADELAQAFTLRYLSKRSYVYLREKLHYPLPGISTLQHWATNINLRSGVLDDVLRIMDVAGKLKPSLKKLTVLSFDEIKVRSVFEYDQKEDEILGPHSYLQVIMARGLFDNWKQPVYLGFDTGMKKNLLENVINKLHSINYEVVASVSDCGGGNQGLWKELNINMERTYMLHPISGKKIYMFADSPHLLKLIRNWFIDTGFILKDEIIISKKPIEALITAASTEINSCHKLTTLHVNCEKTQRQNVALAAQLLSNTTATALKQYKPGDNKELASNVGEFIQLINNWFDIMNSYVPHAKVPTKNPYGKNLPIQNATLAEMETTMKTMRCCSKKSLQVFQKSIIISCRSLERIFTDLKEEYDISYILTHRLNQDCLENFFSQLRTRGGLHDHPSPLNILYRIRMILLGKNPGIVQKNTNVQALSGMEEDDYVVANAFKQAKMVNLHVQGPEQVSLEEEMSDVNSNGSSSCSSFSSSPQNLTERDGLVYIAGYLARKHKQKFPHLGTKTKDTADSFNVHSYNMPSWIASLSFGGLTQPSEPWLQQVKQMEKLFEKFHKNKFKIGHKVIHMTTQYI